MHPQGMLPMIMIRSEMRVSQLQYLLRLHFVHLQLTSMLISYAHAIHIDHLNLKYFLLLEFRSRIYTSLDRDWWCVTPIFISRRRPGGGRYCNVRPSVTLSFCTVTRKRIHVFSRNFAGMCTMSWGWVCCIVFDIDAMLFDFIYECFKYWKNKI